MASVRVGGLPRGRDIAAERRELSTAPRAVQELYWRRDRLKRGRRALPTALGELALRVWPEAGRERSLREIRVVEAALRRILPGHLAESVRVAGIRRGRLYVEVSSASARFVLERQLGPMILPALNAALAEARPGRELQGIEYRTAAPSRGPQRPRATVGRRREGRGSKA